MRFLLCSSTLRTIRMASAMVHGGGLRGGGGIFPYRPCRSSYFSPSRTCPQPCSRGQEPWPQIQKRFRRTVRNSITMLYGKINLSKKIPDNPPDNLDNPCSALDFHDPSRRPMPEGPGQPFQTARMHGFRRAWRAEGSHPTTLNHSGRGEGYSRYGQGPLMTWPDSLQMWPAPRRTRPGQAA